MPANSGQPVAVQAASTSSQAAQPTQASFADAMRQADNDTPANSKDAVSTPDDAGHDAPSGLAVTASKADEAAQAGLAQTSVRGLQGRLSGAIKDVHAKSASPGAKHHAAGKTGNDKLKAQTTTDGDAVVGNGKCADAAVTHVNAAAGHIAPLARAQDGEALHGKADGHAAASHVVERSDAPTGAVQSAQSQGGANPQDGGVKDADASVGVTADRAGAEAKAVVAETKGDGAAVGAAETVSQPAVVHAGASSAAKPVAFAPAATPRQPGDVQIQTYEAATPNRLEIGVTGGTLGWLNVRAQMGADGTVHAMLRASTETATALRAQVPGLESYLAAQALPVSEIAVHAASSSAASTTGFAGSSGEGAQERRQESSQAQKGSGRSSANAADARGRSVPESIVSVPLLAGARSGTAFASTGGWLSVRV